MQEQADQYVVLARKYRPQTFEDLLGQDALVQTLTNAIENNRLHHAYILTGIRGVGKTTTARLIARALNCTGLDGKSGPTIHPCGACENCKAIAQGRHIDVLELDAASRTGVDDIRELLDGVRYKPTNARYKIYIIDEVHMLSKGAFNALLKTLEEPPAHVKFIFATTEIRKVPVTILSRCQRFDLERLKIETLVLLFEKVLKQENISFEPEALEMVARAADGSARDGLSMLDQAIVLGNGKVKAETITSMLGLADRTRTLELFESLVEGKTQKALQNLQEQYQHGADPLALLKDLISVTHLLTKAKIVPQSVNTETVAQAERQLCERLSGSLSLGVLSKLWQMLIKGLSEVGAAPVPLEALEMVLIRVSYSATLPTPAELLEEVKKKSVKIEAPVVSIPQTVQEKPVPVQEPVNEQKNNGSIQTPADLVAYLEAHKKMLFLFALKNDISFEEFEVGKIRLRAKEDLAPDFISNLKSILAEATGSPWQIEIERGALGQTLADAERLKIETDKQTVAEYPLVRAVLAEFKGSKIETLLRRCEKEDEETEELMNYEEEE